MTYTTIKTRNPHSGINDLSLLSTEVITRAFETEAGILSTALRFIYEKYIAMYTSRNRKNAYFFPSLAFYILRRKRSKLDG